jgi:hypothetical protein
MSLGKIYSYPNNPRVAKTLIAAKYNGASVEVVDIKIGEDTKDAAFLKKFPLGKVSSLLLISVRFHALKVLTASACTSPTQSLDMVCLLVSTNPVQLHPSPTRPLFSELQRRRQDSLLSSLPCRTTSSTPSLRPGSTQSWATLSRARLNWSSLQSKRLFVCLLCSMPTCSTRLSWSERLLRLLISLLPVHLRHSSNSVCTMLLIS